MHDLIRCSPGPHPRPLKRSASIASLPTPPRTRRRRKLRSPSAASSDVDLLSSDEEDILSSPIARRGQKNNNPSLVDASGYGEVEANEDEDEDEFWLGSGTSRTLSTGKTSAREAREAASSQSPSSSPVPLLQRRKQASSSFGTAPISPPPSRRSTTSSSSVRPSKAASRRVEASSPPCPSLTVTAAPITTSPPMTPNRTRTTKKREILKRPLLTDSPDNPFLERNDDPDSDHQDSYSSSPETNIPRTHPPHEERPTLAYVFRGVKTQLKNPLYDHVNRRPLPPDPDSLLPPEHPDYSGDLRCPPKLLFPQAHRRRPHPLHTRTHLHSEKSSDRISRRDVGDDSSDDECNDLRSRMELPLGLGMDAGTVAAAANQNAPPGVRLRRSPGE